MGSKNNKNAPSKLIQDITKTFSSKISKASVSNEEIAGVDITNDSIKVAQLSKEGDSWILDKISTRLLDKDQVNNNILEAKDYISEEIKLAISNAKITTTNIALSVPVTSAIIRVVTSPLMTENELQNAKSYTFDRSNANVFATKKGNDVRYTYVLHTYERS